MFLSDLSSTHNIQLKLNLVNELKKHEEHPPHSIFSPDQQHPTEQSFLRHYYTVYFTLATQSLSFNQVNTHDTH